LAEQAKQERDDFLRIIASQKHDEQKEKRIEEQKRKAFVDHSVQLKYQIGSNADTRKLERLDYLEEGRKLRQKQADELLKLETIK